MSYETKDARFDAIAMGKCGICLQHSCNHCPECGRSTGHANYCYWNRQEKLDSEQADE